MLYLIIGEFSRLSTTKPDEFTPTFKNGEFREAMAQAVAVKKAEAKAKLGAVLGDLLDKTSATKRSYISEIRSLRTAERRTKEKLDHIDRCAAYADETGNFVPWACAVGIHYTDMGLNWDDYMSLKDVPSDWTAASDDDTDEVTK